MRTLIALSCLTLSFAAQAAGDPKLGKPLHDKQCVACHVKLLGAQAAPDQRHACAGAARRGLQCTDQRRLVPRGRGSRRRMAEPGLLQIQVGLSPARQARRT